ncbi:MAG: GNAT family N-acetyltransferase [Bacteroidia bacterium]|jgi:RimJ/RimL family protein N-acetyltransferase|nr:GNAT family N-acetyltransferase [Bacteroidia bacterium]
MSWIHPNTILHGNLVELIPLEYGYFEELTNLAREYKIWEFIPDNMSNSERCHLAFRNAINQREKGNQFPFVIFHKKENKIIGSTRLMNIEPDFKKLEIGWTWLHPDYWATLVNLECKLLLLNFCFEELKTIRVQFKTDENNIRSQKAIRKIGAQFEGILRNDMIRDNGTYRNSVYFSIIIKEWQDVRTHLMSLLNSKLNEQNNQ